MWLEIVPWSTIIPEVASFGPATDSRRIPAMSAAGRQEAASVLCFDEDPEKWDASLFPASTVASVEPPEMGKRPNFSEGS
jgi:hypothetical protein